MPSVDQDEIKMTEGLKMQDGFPVGSSEQTAGHLYPDGIQFEVQNPPDIQERIFRNLIHLERV